MSMVYEDEDKRVTVALCDNDYVNVVTMDLKCKLVIRNVDGKLVVEEHPNKKSEVDKNE